MGVDQLADPEAAPPAWEHPELDELAGRLAQAAGAGGRLIWFMGAHVIKKGLGPYVTELMKRGIVRHVAGNGAVAIHDFELAMIGATSESVAEGIENGTFGMWEETGTLMNRAAAEGVPAGRGFGAALGAFMEAHSDRFPYRDKSVIWNAYRCGVPLTLHVTIGADIIHQSPKVDFAVLGEASGIDFRLFCTSVGMLEGGAFLNFGSAVTGPEVFLKALSIVRNLGFSVRNITTANFDIVPLGDYRNAAVAGRERPEYFYRPWKNIIVRPAGTAGKGFHIEGRHQETIPSLYHRLIALMDANENA